MHTNIKDNLTLITNSRHFEANLGNLSHFKALNSENKIQTHSTFSRPRTTVTQNALLTRVMRGNVLQLKFVSR